MILVWYAIASLIVCVVFGLQMMTLVLLNKINYKNILLKYIFQLWFLVIFCVIYSIAPVKVPVFNIAGILSMKNLILFFVTVLLTSFIVSFEKGESHNLFEWFLLGVSMEIPQRLT